MKHLISKTLKGLSFEEAVFRSRKLLQSEGFEIVSEIDVQAAIQREMGVEFYPCYILCAFNARHAYQMLQPENFMGFVQPCQFIVRSEASHIYFGALDPTILAQAVGVTPYTEVANLIKERLIRMLAAL